jgi:hypothetical protein
LTNLGKIGVDLSLILHSVLGDDGFVELSELLKLLAFVNEASLVLDLIKLLGFEIGATFQTLYITDLLRNIARLAEHRSKYWVVLLLLFSNDDFFFDRLDLVH